MGLSIRARRQSVRLLTNGSVLSLLSCAAIAVPTGAYAQLAPTREEVQRPPPPPPPQGRPKLDVEGVVERAPCALDNPDFKDIRVTIRAVDFEGLQDVSAADLAPAYQQFVGTEQPISVVCEVRDRAATILRNAGYIAAVQVPEQRIADGVVHFRVLMAKLTQVRVRGDASGAEQTIAGYLRQLTKQPVFNRYEAERYLLLASDLPGYNVRLTLRPAGTVPGEVIGDVTVQRIAAYADFNLQNMGSQDLGRWGGLLRGQLFGLTGLGDRTTFSVYSSGDFEEQQTVQLGHDFFIGPEGLTVSGNFTYGWAHPDIADADIVSKTLIGTVEVGYPFVRRQASTLRGSLGFDYINQDVDLDEIDLTRDRLREGFVRLGWEGVSMNFARPGLSLAEPLWRVSTSLELRKGLDIFDATQPCGDLGANCLGPGNVPPSRLEGRETAGIVRYTGYGEFRPARKVTLALGARAQYTWKPLLSFDEFSVGNYTVGRGYDPGALLGDRGYGTQAEIRYGSRVPKDAKSPAIEAFAFWDHARVKNLDRLVVVEGSRHVNSVGGGARVNFDRFALDTTLAIPLTEAGILDRKPDPRVLISLTSRLWPWSYK